MISIGKSLLKECGPDTLFSVPGFTLIEYKYLVCEHCQKDECQNTIQCKKVTKTGHRMGVAWDTFSGYAIPVRDLYGRIVSIHLRSDEDKPTHRYVTFASSVAERPLDARALRDTVRPIARGLLLFGHLHVRRRDRLVTPSGTLDVVCASGAALDHPSEDVRAGFNQYQIDSDGRVMALDAHVLDGCDVHLPGGSACPRSEHDMKYRRTLHEAARGRTASVRRLLTDQTSRQEFDLAVLRRVPAALIPGIARPTPVLLLPHQPPVTTSRAHALDVADAADTGGLLRTRIGYELTVGSLSPADSVQVAFVSEGRIVATTRTSPDGEVEFAAGAAVNSLGVLRTGETPPVDVVAEIERQIRVLRPGGQPLLVFDAELDDEVLLQQQRRADSVTRELLAVRLRPTRNIRAIRDRLRRLQLDALVVHARAVLDEGPALDVFEALDPGASCASHRGCVTPALASLACSLAVEPSRCR